MSSKAEKKPAHKRKRADDDGDYKGKEKRPASKKQQCNPYMTFANANRDKLKKENPTLSPTELVKLIGQKWRELSDAEKAVYRTKPAEKPAAAAAPAAAPAAEKK